MSVHYHIKPSVRSSLILFISFLIAILTAWWIGSPLLQLWQSFTAACFQSVSFLTAAVRTIGLLPLAAIGLLFFGLVWASGYSSIRLVRTHRLIRTLARQGRQTASRGIPFYLVPDGRRFAVTLGVWKPKIFISTSLYQRLHPAELAAVLAHEQAHVSGGDTIQLYCWSGIVRLFFFFPILSFCYRRLVYRLELRADQQACARTSRRQLSRALLKLWEGDQPDWLPAGAAGFAFIRERVQALAGQQLEQRPGWRPAWVVSGIVAGALVLAAALPTRPIAAADAMLSLAVADCQPTASLLIKLQSDGLMNYEAIP